MVAAPELLLSELGIPFVERHEPLQAGSSWQPFRAFAPDGKVPCRRDGNTVAWDSLAITGYLAERPSGRPMPRRAAGPAARSRRYEDNERTARQLGEVLEDRRVTTG